MKVIWALLYAYRRVLLAYGTLVMFSIFITSQSPSFSNQKEQKYSCCLGCFVIMHRVKLHASSHEGEKRYKELENRQVIRYLSHHVIACAQSPPPACIFPSSSPSCPTPSSMPGHTPRPLCLPSLLRLIQTLCSALLPIYMGHGRQVTEETGAGAMDAHEAGGPPLLPLTH